MTSATSHLIRPLRHLVQQPSIRPKSVRSVSTHGTWHTLNTGAKIPALGFGTFQDANAQEEAVSNALKAGFRLIDTARVYDVETEVGKGIKRSGVPREEIFLGTKLWCNQFHPDDVEGALNESLADLDTPYVDLLMMHYPVTFKRGYERFPRDSNGTMTLGKTTFVDTWKAMEMLLHSGKTKAIGVSNFSKAEIDALITESNTVCTFRTALTLLPFSLHDVDRVYHRSLLYIRWKCTPTFSKMTSTSGSSPKESMLSSSVH